MSLDCLQFIVSVIKIESDTKVFSFCPFSGLTFHLIRQELQEHLALCGFWDLDSGPYTRVANA